MAPTGHTVKSFDEELDKLSNELARMGGLAEAQLDTALKALVTRDPRLASRVVAADAKVDEHERRIDDQVVRLLALRSPVADDLRLVVAALKTAAALERVADYGANIAKRAVVLAEARPVEPAMRALGRMGRMVREMLKDVLDAYDEQDAERALMVRRRDEEVDDLYTGLFRELLTYMMEDPRTITTCTHLMFIAKNLERVGDLATNIAEMVCFLVEGQPPETERPKADTSAYEGATPVSGAAEGRAGNGDQG